MKRFDTLIVTCLAVLTAAPAFAQQGPGSDYGYGRMWGWGWGWHPGFIFGPIVMFLLFFAVVALIARAGGWWHHGRGFCPHCGRRHGRGALDVLEERFAKGEIDKNEFEEKRKLLER